MCRRHDLVVVQGAGKTSLLKAILAKGRLAAALAKDTHMDFGEEGVSGGLCYSDSAGINLQVHFLLYLISRLFGLVCSICFTLSPKLLSKLICSMILCRSLSYNLFLKFNKVLFPFLKEISTCAFFYNILFSTLELCIKNLSLISICILTTIKMLSISHTYTFYTYIYLYVCMYVLYVLYVPTYNGK